MIILIAWIIVYVFIVDYMIKKYGMLKFYFFFFFKVNENYRMYVLGIFYYISMDDKFKLMFIYIDCILMVREYFMRLIL